MLVKLMGGPLDGQEVEFGGQCFKQAVTKNPLARLPWPEAVYEWTCDVAGQVNGAMFKGILMPDGTMTEIPVTVTRTSKMAEGILFEVTTEKLMKLIRSARRVCMWRGYVRRNEGGVPYSDVSALKVALEELTGERVEEFT